MVQIQLRLGTKFRLKLTLLNLWTKLTKKRDIRSKQNKNYLRILHIQINLQFRTKCTEEETEIQ